MEGTDSKLLIKTYDGSLVNLKLKPKRIGKRVDEVNLFNQILSHPLFQIKDTKNRNHIIQRTDYVPPRWAWW